MPLLGPFWAGPFRRRERRLSRRGGVRGGRLRGPGPPTPRAQGRAPHAVPSVTALAATQGPLPHDTRLATVLRLRSLTRIPWPLPMPNEGTPATTFDVASALPEAEMAGEPQGLGKAGEMGGNGGKWGEMGNCEKLPTKHSGKCKKNV